MRSIRFSALAAVMVSGSLLLSPIQAVNADELDEKRIGEIIEKVLMERPEIIVQALEAYQAKQKLVEESRPKAQVGAQADALCTKADDPFVGNPNGAVTVVEFFDYRCGYCKRVHDDVMALVNENDDVKVVYKEFPILGEASMVAARISLAVNRVAPAKYGEFHTAVMKNRGSLSQDDLFALAEQMGIDTGAVEREMASDDVMGIIRDNYRLAEALGIRGTPAFVVGDQIIPGAASKDALNRLIEQSRG